MTGRMHVAVVCIVIILVLTGPSFFSNSVSADKGKKPVTYNLYFGDLHTHTGYSDAWGDSTPWDAYKAAIDAGADFMAITDHVSIWHAYSGLTMDSEEWSDALAAADFYTSKRFVAMAGYEAWLLGNLGELNVYNVQQLPPAEPLGYRFDRLPDFYDWLASQPGAIAQFNHPLYMSENFEDFSYYTDARDRAINIIEVYNDEFYEASYIMALDAGWHVMPSANSDTHYPDWIDGYEMRTVLLAEKLTPENLYAAMSACRGYATLDRNLRISYTLQGEVMGSVLSMPTSSYKAWIHVEDPDDVPTDAITLVEVVSDGGEVVASVPTGGTIVDLTLTLNSERATYFYVRVATMSNHEGDPGITAWTAPVWTGR